MSTVTANENQQLLTPDQVAKKLQVPLERLNKWRSARKGPPFRKIGRSVRYNAEELQNWIDQSKVETDLKLV